MQTHVVHVLRFIGRSVPAIVEDEDVGFGQTLVNFVEKVLFLCVRKKLRLKLIHVSTIFHTTK